MIMALMAYPDRADETKREDAFKSLVARPLQEQSRLERDDRPYLNERLNTYIAAKTEEEALKSCRRVTKILRARSEVGIVAAPWISEMWKGSEPQLGPMTETALKDGVNARLAKDPDMWIRRIWRPAKPAFHLFAAYEAISQQLPNELKDPFNPESLKVRAPDGILTPYVARLAMAFQRKLTSDRRYRFDREDLFWLDWRDADSATNR